MTQLDKLLSTRRGKPRIPVYEVVVESEIENKGLELCLELDASVTVVAKSRLKDVSRVHRLAIHDDSLSLFFSVCW